MIFIYNWKRVTIPLLFLSVSNPVFSETYSECVLENMKKAGSSDAAIAIKTACHEKTLPYIPAKCTPLKNIQEGWNSKVDRVKQSLGGLDSSIILKRETSYSDCINACLDASYWSKTLGECRK